MNSNILLILTTIISNVQSQIVGFSAAYKNEVKETTDNVKMLSAYLNKDKKKGEELKIKYVEQAEKIFKSFAIENENDTKRVLLAYKFINEFIKDPKNIKHLEEWLKLNVYDLYKDKNVNAKELQTLLFSIKSNEINEIEDKIEGNNKNNGTKIENKPNDSNKKEGGKKEEPKKDEPKKEEPKKDAPKKDEPKKDNKKY